MFTYKETDLQYNQLKEFFNRNKINLNLTEERFNHLLYKNPNGESGFYCAFDGEKLVGTEVHIPINLICNNKIIQSAQAVLSLTDGNYRGHGIWKNLLLFSELKAKEKNLKLIWGVPNANSYPILLNKTKWEIISKSDYYFSFNKFPFKYNIPFFSMLPISLLASYSKIKTKKCNIIIEEYKNHLPYKPHNKTIDVYKSQKYLSWRYIEIPNETFNVWHIKTYENKEDVCIIVTFSYNEVLFIVDYSINPLYSKNLPAIINSLNEKLNCRKINIRLFEGNRGSFKKSGYLRRNSYYIFGNILDESLRKEINSCKWNFSFGDEDIKFVKPFVQSIPQNYNLISKIFHLNP